MLARLAPDRETWEYWVSKDNGSFYELYSRWFGADDLALIDIDKFSSKDIILISDEDFHIPGAMKTQEFLERHGGVLKDYTENYVYADRMRIKTGADAIDNAVVQYNYTLNKLVLITILELKWHLITDPSVSVSEVKKELFSLLKELNQYGYNTGAQSEDKSFLDCVTSLGAVLQVAYENYPRRNILKFHNELVLKSSPEINGGTYALQSLLSLMAEDYTQWEKWVGDSEGSFIEIYNGFILDNSL